MVNAVEVAVAFVPAFAVLNAPVAMVFVHSPVCVPVTLNTIAQSLLAATLPPLIETLLLVSLNVPPQVVLVEPATTRDCAGNVSVSAMP
jgi:hypothetical protein